MSTSRKVKACNSKSASGYWDIVKNELEEEEEEMVLHPDDRENGEKDDSCIIKEEEDCSITVKQEEESYSLMVKYMEENNSNTVKNEEEDDATCIKEENEIFTLGEEGHVESDKVTTCSVYKNIAAHVDDNPLVWEVEKRPALGREYTSHFVVATPWRHAEACLNDCVLNEPHHGVARVSGCAPLSHACVSHRGGEASVPAMDSEEEAVALLLLLRRRRRRKRTLWMHPITSSRLTHGQFYTIMGNLRGDTAKFFNYFRMSPETFDELLTLLGPYIQKANTNMRRSIPAEERLAITLRYLATGCSFADLHYTFRCGSSTARRIVYDVCEKIWENLHDQCFPEMTTEEWLKIAEGFDSQAQFPNCMGAIDGKHVRLIQPTGSGSTYFCYKRFFSMELLAVCDINYRFTYVDIGSYGKASDSSIYKNSDLYQKMQQNTLNIPSDKPVSANGDPLPFVLVGDEAFGLSTHMLRPYGGKNLTHKKKIFNYRLSRARRYIESAFGILTNKWRIFHRPLDVKVENAENIIRGCCTLHNFVRERDGIEFENTLNVVGLNDGIGAVQVQGPRSALTIREKFTDYFSTEEGSVSWQERLIGRKV